MGWLEDRRLQRAYPTCWKFGEELALQHRARNPDYKLLSEDDLRSVFVDEIPPMWSQAQAIAAFRGFRRMWLKML